MLGLAGDYGKKQRLLPEPPVRRFQAMRRMSRRLYRQQQGTSRHASTLVWIGPEGRPPRPRARCRSRGSDHRFGFSRKGDDHIELESRVEDRVIRAVVEYALGSGRHGITMVAKDEAALIASSGPPTTARAKAGARKGVELRRATWLIRSASDWGDRNVHHCLHCHATWFRSVDLQRSGPARTGSEVTTASAANGAMVRG